MPNPPTHRTRAEWDALIEEEHTYYRHALNHLSQIRRIAEAVFAMLFILLILVLVVGVTYLEKVL